MKSIVAVVIIAIFTIGTCSAQGPLFKTYSISFNLLVEGETISSPSDEYLLTLYGPDYRSSVFYRTQEALTTDTKIGRHFEKLQSSRGYDMVVDIEFDSEKVLRIGETFTDYDHRGQVVKRTCVKKGDSLETVANRLSISKEELIKDNHWRFNQTSGALWSDGSIRIGESRRDKKEDEFLGELSLLAAYTSEKGPRDCGNDLDHYVYEVTNRRSAWCEGWAVYNQGIFCEMEQHRALLAIKSMEIETADSTVEEPKYVTIENPDFSTHLSCAGIVSTILTMVDGRGKHRNRIFDVFEKGHQNKFSESSDDRNIVSFTRNYMIENPEQAIRTILAIDCVTGFRADEADLLHLFGNSADVYSKTRQNYQKVYESDWHKHQVYNVLDLYAMLDQGLESESSVRLPNELRDTPSESLELLGESLSD